MRRCGMKTITGCKKSGSTVEGDVVRANQFNHFYNRFDNTAPGVHDCLTPVPASPPSAANCSLHATPTPPLPLLGPQPAWPHSLQLPALCHSPQLHSSPRRPPPPPPHHHGGSGHRRAEEAAPRGVCPRLLKACAVELGEPLQHLSNRSLQLGEVLLCGRPPASSHPEEAAPQ